MNYEYVSFCTGLRSNYSADIFNIFPVIRGIFIHENIYHVSVVLIAAQTLILIHRNNFFSFYFYSFKNSILHVCLMFFYSLSSKGRSWLFVLLSNLILFLVVILNQELVVLPLNLAPKPAQVV